MSRYIFQGRDDGLIDLFIDSELLADAVTELDANEIIIGMASPEDEIVIGGVAASALLYMTSEKTRRMIIRRTTKGASLFVKDTFPIKYYSNNTILVFQGSGSITSTGKMRIHSEDIPEDCFPDRVSAVLGKAVLESGAKKDESTRTYKYGFVVAKMPEDLKQGVAVVRTKEYWANQCDYGMAKDSLDEMVKWSMANPMYDIVLLAKSMLGLGSTLSDYCRKELSGAVRVQFENM